MEKDTFVPPRRASGEVIELALEQLAVVFRTLLWEQAKLQGLSPIQIQFLFYIGGAIPGENTVSALAKRFNLTQATVSGAVTTLVRKGLLTKEAEKQDRRKTILATTPAGKQMLRKLNEWNRQLLSLIDDFPLQMRQTVIIFLLQLLESLRDNKILAVAQSCFSCMHLLPENLPEEVDQYFCLYRNESFNNIDLQVDCPNYKTKKPNRD